MKPNVTIVARAIASYLGDKNIQKSLSSMFNFELENINVKNPPYKEKYKEIISNNSANWKNNENEEVK